MDKEFKEKYPEHAKLEGKMDEMKTIQSFCMFLQGNNLLHRRIDKDHSFSYRTINSNQISEIIAEYFDIDHKAYQEEKTKMLEAYQNSD